VRAAKTTDSSRLEPRRVRTESLHLCAPFFERKQNRLFREPYPSYREMKEHCCLGDESLLTQIIRNVKEIPGLNVKLSMFVEKQRHKVRSELRENVKFRFEKSNLRDKNHTAILKLYMF